MRAAPDGYTLLLATTPNAVNATLYEKLPFNFIRDIAPIASISRVPLVMVVNASFPAKTVPEFIAYAKANPGKINMASAGKAESYQLAMIFCNLTAAWGIARLLSVFRVKAVGLVLAIITIGFAVQPSYPSLAQATEATLLIFATTSMAQSKYALAISLTTVAVFAKPTMGYLYLLVLFSLVFYKLRTEDSELRAYLRAVLPCVLTFVTLGGLLSGVLGLAPLVNTIFPIEGARNYQALHFGFFQGVGRSFWDTTGVPSWQHLFDISGFWIAASILLIVFASVDAVRLWKGTDGSDAKGRTRTQVVVACAVLHTSFVLFFFGNRGSWIYYSYLLIIGLVLAIDTTRLRLDLGVLMCVLGLFAWTDVAIGIRSRASTMSPSSLTQELWATTAENTEWSNILALASHKKARILDTKGDAELMYPFFGRPVSLYLDPGLMNSTEVRQKVLQLYQADLVVVPINVPDCSDVPRATEIETTMRPFDLLWRGKFFEVFERHFVRIL